ncbi:hypothetical protein GCM10023403_26760 [Pseudonocardia benzenivorans]
MGVATFRGVLPHLDEDGLTDSGRWRELGVTHWHLTVGEVTTGDPARYRIERWRELVGARYEGTTDDPREALRWITDQRIDAVKRATHPDACLARAGWDSEARWLAALEVTWMMLTRTLGPAGGGISVSDGRSIEIYADAMSPRSCGKAH